LQDTVSGIGLALLDGYCSTVQGVLDWFDVELGFAELLFMQRKMRLEMIVEMHIEILNGGAILSDCKTQITI